MTERSSNLGRAHAVVVGDPLKELEVGSGIMFQPRAFQFEVDLPEATVSNWELFEGTLLMVCFTSQEEQRIIGSAVIVAPGIALSASHVIQPELDAVMSGGLVVSCQGLTSHGLQIWNIHKVLVIPNTDVTILSIKLISSLPPEGCFALPVISTRLPKVGERVHIWGFRAGEETFPLNTDRQGVECTANLWVGNGLVTERYPKGRDTGMLPWPVIEVDCSTRGGMSGGPVYDMHGLLIGLLCSSFETEDGGVTYLSMLWPALTQRFESTWPPGLIPTSTSLIEMSPRLCAIDKPEAVVSKHDEVDGTIRTTYKIWE